jgi:hypothetical protein
VPRQFRARVKGRVVVLSWINPRDADFERVVVVERRTRRPRSPSDGTRVYRGRASQAAVTGRPGTRLRFAIFAFDVAGNASSPAYTDARLAPSSLRPASGAILSGSPLLAWIPVRGASYYNVQIFFRGRRIANRWPAGPRVRLSARTFRQRGVYTWYVWPGLGPRSAANYGKLIGRATFTYRRG